MNSDFWSPIGLGEFNSRTGGVYGPAAACNIPIEHWSERSGVLLGVIVVDRVDGDYGYVVLGRFCDVPLTSMRDGVLNNCNVRAPPSRIRRALGPKRSHAADARRPSSLFSDASSAYHPLAAGPETRPQLLLVDLANAGQRQLRNEFDVFRRVSGSLSLFDEINQFSGRRRGVSSRNDESGDGFAPLVVGRAYHGDHKDARMSRDHILRNCSKREAAAQCRTRKTRSRALRNA